MIAHVATGKALKPEHSVPALRSQDYWYADIDKSLCLNATKTCRFYFSFCHPIPPEVKGACYGSGVCQIGDDSSNTTYGLGLFQNTTVFYPSEHMVKNLFHLIVLRYVLLPVAFYLMTEINQLSLFAHGLTSCINGKESSLIPTLRLENLANILTECFSLHQGKSR